MLAELAIYKETKMIEQIDLDKKHTVVELTKLVATLIDAVNELSARPQGRDRGPKSDKPMTEDDARRVIMGDLKDASHKVAAETLELSYGQIYSARKCFTFKGVNQEARDAAGLEK